MSYETPSGRRGRWRLNRETGEFEKIKEPPKIQVHYVQTDEIPPTQSMTGSDKWFTSKSALRRHYKEEGFVEVGTVLPTKKERKTPEQHRREVQETVEKTYYDLKYDRISRSEIERENSIREERACQRYKK